MQDLDFKQIVTSTLTIGQIHKNYKAICQVLGQEVKKGDSKKSQLKTWKQYFNWEMQGQKWIITEIYDSVQEREDKRKENGKQATLGLDGELLFYMTQINLLQDNGHYDNLIHTNIMQQNDLSVQLGMRSPLFKPLNDNKHLFTTHKVSSLDDYYCHAQTHNVVFYDIYNRQRGQITAMKIQGLKVGTLIYEYVKDDNTTKGDLVPHLANPLEQVIIEECRNKTIDNWNKTHTHKKQLQTVGEVRDKLNYGEQQLFWLQNEELTKESFGDNYSYCSSVFVYDCNIKSEIEKLQALGCDITMENYDEFISHWSPFLRHEVNERALKYRYEHVDNKLQEHEEFDLERQKVQSVRHYGKTRHDKYEYANSCLIHEYDQAKVLVRLAFSVDLTKDDYKFVEKLLKEDE